MQHSAIIESKQNAQAPSWIISIYSWVMEYLFILYCSHSSSCHLNNQHVISSTSVGIFINHDVRTRSFSLKRKRQRSNLTAVLLILELIRADLNFEHNAEFSFCIRNMYTVCICIAGANNDTSSLCYVLLSCSNCSLKMCGIFKNVENFVLEKDLHCQELFQYRSHWLVGGTDSVPLKISPFLVAISYACARCPGNSFLIFVVSVHSKTNKVFAEN